MFLDKKRLKNGRRFDLDFAKGLARSIVIVPIVSVDALQRMAKHSPDQVDNVLVEWLIMQECYRTGKGRIKAVYPVVFGKRQVDGFSGVVTIGNLFQDPLLQDLPDEVPSATIRTALAMMQSSDIQVENTEQFSSQTVKSIVTEMLKFLCCTTWEHSSSGVVEVAVTEAVNILRKYASDYADVAQHVDSSGSATSATPVTVNAVSGAGAGGSSLLSLKECKRILQEEVGIIEASDTGSLVEAVLNELNDEKVTERCNRLEKAIDKLRFLVEQVQ